MRAFLFVLNQQTAMLLLNAFHIILICSLWVRTMRTYVINMKFQQCCMMLMSSTTHHIVHSTHHSIAPPIEWGQIVLSYLVSHVSGHTLSCPVFFTPAPSFRTRYCTFVLLPSLLLTAAAAATLYHSQSLPIHSSPLLCSATYSTHKFSANMICMNQFWRLSSLSSTLVAFRL